MCHEANFTHSVARAKIPPLELVHPLLNLVQRKLSKKERAMKTFIYLLFLSSVLMACERDKTPQFYDQQPLRNEVEMSFIGVDKEDKFYGYNSDLSSVECRYNSANSSLRVVAYKFLNTNGELKIEESLQLTDYAVQNSKSGFLKPMEGDIVPAFIFLSDAADYKYTAESNCSTYYEFVGDELKGNVLCSALQSNDNEKTFVSLEFQCMNQNFLLFEIKEEMM